MMRSYDVAVIGLGAMGSAAAFHLARRGMSVIGFDRFSPPHSLGSSHGETRIIREAYFEDPRYVPMVQRSAVLWEELERASGTRLFFRTGGLMIGLEDGTLVRGARASAETHRLPCEVLGARALRERYPAFRPREDEVGVWEPRAGVLFPDSCVAAHLESARAAGAELRTDEPVIAWRASGEGFEIETARGRFAAGALVLAAGAWIPSLAHGLALPLEVTRQPIFWFEPKAHPERFDPERFPIYIWEHEPGRYFYGFPAFEGRIKVATHMEGAPADPDSLDREVTEQEVAVLRARLRDYLPDAEGRFHSAAVCMYASTPDGHFAIDRHPDHPRAIVLSACSGHGFKFAPAIGEIAADLVEGRAPATPLELFRLRWR